MCGKVSLSAVPPETEGGSMWPCVIQVEDVGGSVAGDPSIPPLLPLVYVLLPFLSHLTTGLINRLFNGVQGPSNNKVSCALLL